MLGQQHNLSDVMWIVRNLAIDGLHYRVRFTPNGDGAAQVHISERLERAKENRPAGFPLIEQLLARGRRIGELAVAVAVRLLAVAGEKVRSPRTHVAGHVFHDDGDRVGLVVELEEKLLVGHLSHSAVAEQLVVAEERDGVFNVGRGELECHAESVRRFFPLEAQSVRRVQRARTACLPRSACS